MSMRKNPDSEGFVTIEILLERKPFVERGLEDLNKRAKKKKLPPLTWTWGRPFVTEETRLGRFVRVEVIPITLPIESPKYAGWKFVATLQHLGGDNIVRSVTGHDDAIPRKYRSAGPDCEHCRTSRQRADTYLLQHDDGSYIQVGSSCLKDFLGSDKAVSLALQATFYMQATALLKDEGWLEAGSNRPPILMLSTYLSMVAFFIRDRGWVSKKMAQERGGDVRPTATLAWNEFFRELKPGEKRAEPTKEDEEMAENAIAWAEGLSDEEVDKEGMGDYLHNVRAVARSGIAELRSSGIAASIVAAYSRAKGLGIGTGTTSVLNEWLGTVGEKLTVVARLDFFYRYETDYGITTLLKFVTPEGATVAWRASASPVAQKDIGNSTRSLAP